MLLTTTLRAGALPLLLAGATCFAESIRGTLYADQGGSGGGIVRIATNKCIFEFNYLRGYPQRFSKDVCRELGAKWTVQAEITHPGSGDLRSARCIGEVDSSIHSAWLIAAQYLDLIAANSYDAASKLLSSSPGHLFNPTDPRDLDASAYAIIGGHGGCISVTERNKDEVILRAENACGIEKAGKVVYVLIRVINEGSIAGWRVEGISAYY